MNKESNNLASFIFSHLIMMDTFWIMLMFIWLDNFVEAHATSFFSIFWVWTLYKLIQVYTNYLYLSIIYLSIYHLSTIYLSSIYLSIIYLSIYLSKIQKVMLWNIKIFLNILKFTKKVTVNAEKIQCIQLNYLNTQNSLSLYAVLPGTNSSKSAMLFFSKYSDLAFCSEDKQTEGRMVVCIP